MTKTQTTSQSATSPYLIITEVAHCANVHTRTVRRWMDDGVYIGSNKIKLAYTEFEGRRWISKDDLARFLSYRRGTGIFARPPIEQRSMSI